MCAVRINFKHFRSSSPTAARNLKKNSRVYYYARPIGLISVPFPCLVYLPFSRVSSAGVKEAPITRSVRISSSIGYRFSLTAKWSERALQQQLSKSSTSVFMMTDWGPRYYSGSSEDNSYYAAPVYGCYSVNPENSEVRMPISYCRLEIFQVPKKIAPSLSRQSTCRPTSTLYLPRKKRKRGMT